MFKYGDDLRQDNLVISLFKMMDKIWNKSNLGVEMVAYDVLETGYMTGCIEFVDNSKTISDMHANAGFCGPFKEASIMQFLVKKINEGSLISD
jgi:phosphatidylinositol kinase/protein kinase (PI-3  family)